MTAWYEDELRRVADADDLHISPFREAGVTYGKPTWNWSVALDDDLYVRAYNGRGSRWYQAAMRQKAGPICRRHDKGGFVRPGRWSDQRSRRHNNAYRAKYHRSPYVGPMIGTNARSTTVRVMPRETGV
jgi:hypothetical protein